MANQRIKPKPSIDGRIAIDATKSPSEYQGVVRVTVPDADEPTPETTVGGETMEVTLTAYDDLPADVEPNAFYPARDGHRTMADWANEVEAQGDKPAPIIDQLGNVAGFEAQAIRDRLLEMRNHIDNAISSADKSHPQVAEWLRKLKVDL